MYEGKDGTIEDIITGGALFLPGAWARGPAPPTNRAPWTLLPPHPYGV